jgi:hypothetical protein
MPENEPAETRDTASRSVEAGIADETAAYKAMTPTEGGTAEDESEAQPS